MITRLILAFLTLLGLCECTQAQVTAEPFNTFISSLATATTPLSNLDKLYVLQGGVSKSLLGNQINTGGSSSALNLNVTRAQIPTTNIGNNVTIRLNGYRTANDIGFGAVYTSAGSPSCTTGLMFIKDSANNCFVLVPPTGGLGYNPGWFGAKADDGATTITNNDITANPQWRGTYTAGTSWDTVALQETIYASFAGTSTPGVITWNAASGNTALNIPLYVPIGTYGINKRLLANMQGGTVIFAARGQALLDWSGAGGSSSDYVWYCDGCSYSLFVNASFQNTQIQTFGSAKPVFALDFTNNIASLKTQQNTFINLYISVGINGQGFAFNPVGGGTGQGDTNQFINPVFLGSLSDWAMQVNGSNALNNAMFGGDIQGFPHDGIQVLAGNLSVYNSHAENQNAGIIGPGTAPVMTQFTNYGADFNMYSQVNGSAPSVISAFRSESDILAISQGSSVNLNDNLNINGAAIVANDVLVWAPGTAYQEGTVVAGGTDGRVFMLVDAGTATGTMVGSWQPISSFVSTTITDLSNTYATNSLVGRAIDLRFNSNGFFQQSDIVSNTGHTITIDPRSGGLLSTQAQYAVLGFSGTSAPNWNSAAVGTQANFPAASQGFQINNGSNCVFIPSSVGNPLVGDYIAIPLGYLVGANSFPTVFTAKITALNNCTPLGQAVNSGSTVSRTANRTLNNVAGYTATSISDGTNGMAWIDLEYIAAGPANYITDFEASTGGKIGAGGSMANVFTVKPAATSLDTTFFSGVQTVVAGTTAIGVNGYSHADSLCTTLPTTATVDLTNTMSRCNAVSYTPTQNATLNAPAGYVNSSQEFVILITTSGTTSFTITCGTNLKCDGPFQTGTTSGAVEALVFKSNGTSWVRTSAAPSQHGTSVPPTASACTGFSLGTGASDFGGKVAFTSATACSMTFGQSFINPPACTVSPGSAASTTLLTASTTVLSLTFGTAQTSASWNCVGN